MPRSSTDDVPDPDGGGPDIDEVVSALRWTLNLTPGDVSYQAARSVLVRIPDVAEQIAGMPDDAELLKVETLNLIARVKDVLGSRHRRVAEILLHTDRPEASRHASIDSDTGDKSNEAIDATLTELAVLLLDPPNQKPGSSMAAAIRFVGQHRKSVGGAILGAFTIIGGLAALGFNTDIFANDGRIEAVTSDSTVPRNQFPNPLVCSSEPTTTGPFTFFNAEGTESGDGRNIVNCENVVFTQPYRAALADRSFQLNFERCWADTIIVSDGNNTWTVIGDQGECTDPSAGPITVVEGQAISITLTVRSESGREFAYYVSSRAEPPPSETASEELDGQEAPETALADFAAPPLVLRDDRPGTASQLAPLADGGIVGVGDPEFGVEIWDLAGQSPRSSYPGHGTADVHAFTELGDNRLVTGGELGFQIWAIGDTDSDTGKEQKQTITALATLPDGRIAAGDETGMVKVWGLTDFTLPEIEARGHFDATADKVNPITGIALLDSGFVVSAATDGIRVWEPTTPNPGTKTTIRGSTPLHPQPVNAIAALGETLILAAGPADDETAVLIINSSTGVADRYGGHTDPVSDIALMGSQAATGDAGGNVRLWDPNRPEDNGQLVATYSSSIETIAALPEGRLAIATSDGSVEIHAIGTAAVENWPTSGRIGGIPPGMSGSGLSGNITFFAGPYDEASASYIDSRLRDNIAGICYDVPVFTQTSTLVLPAGPGYLVTVGGNNHNPGSVSLEFQPANGQAGTSLNSTSC